jgi:hypothetical protein
MTLSQSFASMAPTLKDVLACNMSETLLFYANLEGNRIFAPQLRILQLAILQAIHLKSPMYQTRSQP